MNATTKKRHYASLTGPLIGMYFPLPAELETDDQRRVALSTSRLARLWCAVYDEAEVDRQIAEYRHGTKLPDDCARRLDYDAHEVFR